MILKYSSKSLCSNSTAINKLLLLGEKLILILSHSLLQVKKSGKKKVL